MIQGFDKQEGLLFYLSADKSLTADFAKGQAAPNFAREIEVIENDGACGGYVCCGDHQAYAYTAPGNIYAQRGTLAFFWRSRYPVGKTEFPIFRVGYVDHTSWDACWLRIDYNGHGLDAFITDLNLSRARVSIEMDSFPKEDEWMHIALAWDENFGIKLYVNGEKKAELFRPGMYAAGLDQFGPHSRAVSHWNVSSAYNFIRGGDIDEIAIFDRMVGDCAVKDLAQGKMPETIAPLCVTMDDPLYRAQWYLRCGFSRDDYPRLMGKNTVVRKVEVEDAYDLKRWWWKGCDGIRETTWPGTFNRSRLTGRNDYFQLPDWDCYSISGKTVDFHLPKEKWNHIEISGSAYGKMVRVNDDNTDGALLFDRAQGQERTFHDMPDDYAGKVRFTNIEIEEPIGDFSAFYVYDGEIPAGSVTETYRLVPGFNEKCPVQNDLAAYIRGRYAAYERNIFTGVQDGETPEMTQGEIGGYAQYNIILPYTPDDSRGLDGVVISFPEGLEARWSVQVRDPLLYYRNLAHFTLATSGKHAANVFFDTRDRILPHDKCLYLVIGADREIDASCLSVTAVYKDKEKCLKEHCDDRFRQVRDVYGHITEEGASSMKLGIRRRYEGDLKDLLRSDPNHFMGQIYYYSALSRYFAVNEATGKLEFRARRTVKNGREDDVTPLDTPEFDPPVQLPEAPEGTPAWAFEQIEFLKSYKKLINWYIDERQIENGEFGGGLSDDGDFTASWVPLVLMGSDSKKMLKSLIACTDAFYEQGLFTNGLCTIQADELHSSEEGAISIGQVLSAEPGNPQYLEHAMETARALPWLSGINKAGHRHIKSSYFSGTKMATEHPWGYSKPNCFISINPVWLLTRFNNNPVAKKIMLELADGMMPHYHDGVMHGTVCFETDEEVWPEIGGSHSNAIHTLLYGAYRTTGKEDYLTAIGDFGFTPARVEGALDKQVVANKYRSYNLVHKVREFYNTLGSPWIDRVFFDYYDIQYDRLGGAGHMRFRAAYPRNLFSWAFKHEGDDEKLAILTPWQAEDKVRMVVYNAADAPVQATLTGSEILPGKWKIVSGADTNDDDIADADITEKIVHWEPFHDIELTFAPGVTTVVTFDLVEKCDDLPKQRYDLGISCQDVKLFAHGLKVTVHSLGAQPTPEAEIALVAPDGKVLDSAVIPPLDAPTDLLPRTWEVALHLWNCKNIRGCRVVIDPAGKLHETTQKNNIVEL